MNNGSAIIFTLGLDFVLIERLCDRIENKENIKFMHLIMRDYEFRKLLSKKSRSDLILMNRVKKNSYKFDLGVLGKYESSSGPTINNIILSDYVLRNKPRQQALQYISYLINEIELAINQQRPKIFLGSFDGAHSAIAFLVCKKLNIPYVSIFYTNIPRGLIGFCADRFPNSLIDIGESNLENIPIQAQNLLSNFLNGEVSPPFLKASKGILGWIYEAPNNLKNLIIRGIRALGSEFDSDAYPSLRYSIYRHYQKFINTIFFPRNKLINEVPSEKFVFFGMHMQPESSIDVWASYYSNQIHLIESIARSLPVNYKFLIKLHPSDPYRLSSKQIKSLKNIPGIEVVNPFVTSRKFLESAEIIFTIQGNIGLEGALLGRKVIVFGETCYLDFPNVYPATGYTGLTKMISDVLSMPLVEEGAIISGLEKYLSKYQLGMTNVWSEDINAIDILNMSLAFKKLINYYK